MRVHPIKQALWFLAAFIVPPIVCLPAVLIGYGLHPIWAPFFFWSAVASGCFCIMMVPDRWPIKVFVAGLYLPCAIAALFVYCLELVGMLYHRYL